MTHTAVDGRDGARGQLRPVSGTSPTDAGAIAQGETGVWPCPETIQRVLGRAGGHSTRRTSKCIRVHRAAEPLVSNQAAGLQLDRRLEAAATRARADPARPSRIVLLPDDAPPEDQRVDLDCIERQGDRRGNGGFSQRRAGCPRLEHRQRARQRLTGVRTTVGKRPAAVVPAGPAQPLAHTNSHP